MPIDVLKKCKVRKKVLKGIYPLYTRINALVEVAKALPNPILVYQMGKVGSTTVHKSLHEAGVPSVHVHYINYDQWRKKAKLRTKNDSPLPPHFHKGRLLRCWITWTDRNVRVISLVRDPIERYVSEAFQTAHFRGFPSNDPEHACKKLREDLASNGSLRYTYEWFDREFGSVFDLDVLDHPFNQEKGFGQITSGNVDILILALENLESLIPSILSDFVGCSLEPKRDRTRTNQVYTQVKDNLTLPESTVRRLYDSPWMRHFYTIQDIERFVERWSKE